MLRGRRALLVALLENGEATADHVRNALKLPEGINPVCLGVVPVPLARAGIIEPAGFTKSRRARAHARPVQIWRLADRAAAIDWLAAHPGRPDPPVNAEADAEPTLFDLNQNATRGAGTLGGHRIRRDSN
ncbi:MAG: hypothetical protein JXQ75_00525 [Phycisphaerae bacterium]|nr:hypothetical protein [Phycisphaerae bacterium]